MTMRYSSESILSLVLSVFILPLGGCEPGTLGPVESTGPEISSVTISPNIATLDAPGSTAQFVAKVRDVLGKEMPDVSVSWLTTDPEVATISESGMATVVGEGSSIIIAVASDDVSGWATLNAGFTELLISSSAPPTGSVGEGYTHTMLAEGASAPVWSISEGALPDGIGLDGSTGVISGTPTTIGISPFTIVVTSGGRSVSRNLTITIVSATLGKGFGDDQFELIAAGAFMMGSTTGATEEQPVHQVNITEPFYLQKSEVTQGQWMEIMGSNPSGYKTCGMTCPVERISYDKIQEFIYLLNTKYPGQNFRLPTEAEWEYAARAGTTGDYGGTGVLDDMGWYSENSNSQTRPVGLKQANAWGLFDMHGNVHEWVNDFYSETYYGESPTDDPQGPEGGEHRVLRGGETGRDANWAKVSTRAHYRSNYWGFSFFFGLRLVKDPS
jgi:hypothetical protein